MLRGDDFLNIHPEEFVSTSTPDVETPVKSTLGTLSSSSFSNLLDPPCAPPPITPIAQIGSSNREYFRADNFSRILNNRAQLSSPTVPLRTRPILKQSPIITTLPQTPTSANSNNSFSNGSFDFDLDMNTQIQILPEYSTLSLPTDEELPEYADVNCVVNIKKVDYEPSPNQLNREDQIKVGIAKTKITNEILKNFDEKIVDKKNLNVANLGALVLFEIFDTITLNQKLYLKCQCFLFEDALLVLSSEGDQIIVLQEMTSKQISSITEDEHTNSIIINVISLKLPEISLRIFNNIIQKKWLKVLSRLVALKVKQAALEANVNNGLLSPTTEHTKPKPKRGKQNISSTIPLIQLSANAWGLVASNESIIPAEVLKYNKLVSKGLDLPFMFLKRQMPSPGSIPVTMIVCIPCKMDEELDMELDEYTQSMKDAINKVIDGLDEDDKLGLVFLGVPEALKMPIQDGSMI
ncbi:unnamed protein product [Ambrosiozyma monospora]|uniref:Unnamed protein product n=1 Tax=Ambrosiozyma monospora TaxID=43982 RepID=A0ACB5TQU8_AMBMO|nr:unnamed protein product [Ambrosiozyma monospora]